MRKIVELATKLSLNNRMGRWSYMETLPMSTYEASLKRLDINCVDFYYQNRIEKHVPIEVTETIQALQSIYQYNASKEQGFILTEITYGQWKDQNEAWKSCWRVPSLEGKLFGGYVFFSLSNGPEYHAPQIANVVGVARHLGAIVVLLDIRATKLGEKKDFGEIYDVKKFVANAVVQVARVEPTEISSMKFTAVRVPHMVSEDFITSKIEPIFRTKRNLRLTTYFDSLSMAKLKETMRSNGWISVPGYIWKSQVASRVIGIVRFDGWDTTKYGPDNGWALCSSGLEV